MTPPGSPAPLAARRRSVAAGNAHPGPRTSAPVEAMGTIPLPGTEHLGPGEGRQYATWTHLARIEPNPSNPRPAPTGAAQESLAELAASIRAQGLLEPLVVAPGAIGVDGSDRYVLIAGHRRRLALQRLIDAGEHDGRVLVVVRPDLTEPAAMTAAALVENLHREDLSPLAEARALLTLRDVHGWAQAQIARAIGRNPSHVSRRLSLLDAVPLLTELIEAGTVALDIAVDLTKLDADLQQRAARQIARGEATPAAARRQALDDADAANARTQAVQSLSEAGLRYEQLEHGRRPPAPSPLGPVPVSFPGYGDVLAAHDARPAGTSPLPCEVRYVTRSRRHDVVTDPGANAYPGFDPAFVTGRWCTEPDTHRPATASEPTTAPASAEPAPAARSRWATGAAFSDAAELTARAAAQWASPAPAPPASAAPARVGARADREDVQATMRRTAFLHRLLADRLPPHAAAFVAAHTLTVAALAPDPVLAPAWAPDDPGAPAAALRHAVALLGPAQAPVDASAVAARRAVPTATHGASASADKRARFALALALAQGDAAVVTATAAASASPLAPVIAPAVHLIARDTLSALAAWGHQLHPLEHLVIDAAPGAPAALAALDAEAAGGLDESEPAARSVLKSAAPQPDAGAEQVQRMSPQQLVQVLVRAGADVPDGAPREVLLALVAQVRAQGRLADAGAGAGVRA